MSNEEKSYPLSFGGMMEYGKITLKTAPNGHKHCDVWIESKGLPKFRIPAGMDELKQLSKNINKILKHYADNSSCKEE